VKVSELKKELSHYSDGIEVEGNIFLPFANLNFDVKTGEYSHPTLSSKKKSVAGKKSHPVEWDTKRFRKWYKEALKTLLVRKSLSISKLGMETMGYAPSGRVKEDMLIFLRKQKEIDVVLHGNKVILIKLKEKKHDIHYMTRQHAKVPVDKDKQRIALARNTKPIKEFPHFDNVKDYFLSNLRTMLKELMFEDRKSLGFRDFESVGINDVSSYVKFVREFIQKSGKISDFFGVTNKFKLEGNSLDYKICYS